EYYWIQYYIGCGHPLTIIIRSKPYGYDRIIQGTEKQKEFFPLDLDELRNYCFSPLKEEYRRFSIVKTVLRGYGEHRHTYLREMTNGEIIHKMQEIIDNQQRSSQELEWLHKGLTRVEESLLHYPEEESWAVYYQYHGHNPPRVP